MGASRHTLESIGGEIRPVSRLPSALALAHRPSAAAKMEAFGKHLL